MQAGTYIIHIGSSEYPEFHIATWIRKHELPRFHWMQCDGRELLIHETNIHPDNEENRKCLKLKPPGA